jgi:hypothetical protein
MTDERAETPSPERAPEARARVRWDDSDLRSSYANVCNVSGTREEVVLMFGVNQAWERGRSEVQVQLTDRIILSPFAAKRLADVLAGVLREYEARFGALGEGAGSGSASAA